MLTFIRNKVVHGALTNGHDWIFLLIKLNDDYEGASYKYSVEIHLEVMQNLDFHRPPSVNSVPLSPLHKGTIVSAPSPLLFRALRVTCLRVVLGNLNDVH